MALAKSTMKHTHTRTHAHAHTHTFTHARARTRACTHPCTHTQTYTHTHTRLIKTYNIVPCFKTLAAHNRDCHFSTVRSWQWLWLWRSPLLSLLLMIAALEMHSEPRRHSGCVHTHTALSQLFQLFSRRRHRLKGRRSF